MSRVIDFDAFRAERKEEPVTLRIGGEVFELASSLPASVAVDLIRLKKDMNEADEVPVETLDMVGNAVFGTEVWRVLLAKHRVTVSELSDLIQMVLEAYNPKGDDKDPPEASA